MKMLAEFVGVNGIMARREVFIVQRDVNVSQIKDFGLTLEEAKGVLRQMQAEQMQFQVEQCGVTAGKCLQARSGDKAPRTKSR